MERMCKPQLNIQLKINLKIFTIKNIIERGVENKQTGSKVLSSKVLKEFIK